MSLTTFAQELDVTDLRVAELHGEHIADVKDEQRKALTTQLRERGPYEQDCSSTTYSQDTGSPGRKPNSEDTKPSWQITNGPSHE